VRKSERFHLGRIVISTAVLCGTLAGVTRPGQAPAPQGSQSAPLAPTDVVLTVGNQKITLAEFEKIASSLPPQFSGALAQLGKRGFADQYANLLALSQEGEKLGIAQDEAFRQMVEFQRVLLLAQTTLNQLAGPQATVLPEDVQSFYDSNQSEFEELHLRGIYIPFDDPGNAASPPQPPAAPANPNRPKLTEAAARARAEALRTQIQGGADMAALARTESEHPTSSAGGDFGFVKRNQFAAQIDSAIFALQPNQVTEPLRDRFGFFLFQLVGKRAQPFEEVRTTIENNLRQERLVALFNRMKESYPVTLDPRYFPETPDVPAPLR